MQVGVNVTCMYTNFGGRGYSVFGNFSTLKNGQISLSDHGLYSPWSSKNFIEWNRLKKFMQIRIDELCICINFGGCDLSSFGDIARDIATLKNDQISFPTMDYIP